MGCRVVYSIKTHFRFLNSDFVYDHMFRVVSLFCSYLFGVLPRRFFRNEESRDLREYEPNLEVDRREKQSISSSRYEYWSGKGICRFFEEAETLSFTVHESYMDSGVGDPVSDMQKVGVDEEETEEFFESNTADDEEVLEENEEAEFIDEIISDRQKSVSNASDGHEFEAEKTEQFVSNDEIMASDNHELETEELVSKDVIIASDNREFETEKTEDSAKTVVVDDVSDMPEMEEIYDLKGDNDESSNDGRLQSEFDQDEESALSDDLFPEEIGSISKGVSGTGFFDHLPEPEHPFSEEDYTDSEDEHIEFDPKNPNLITFEDESSSDGESFDEQVSEKTEESSCLFEGKEVEKEADYSVEHEDLIQQLKLELKLARTGGLPTILEESESEELETPKSAAQHLKPMKIDDQKLDYKNILQGVRKVYKNYSDKMRKLDILNFQTMHALGLLEMKGGVDFNQSRKSSSVPAVISLLSHNLWLCKGTAVIEPMKKIISDMNRDLESVYIGHLCLSWEMLHWQYLKALELRNYASQGSHFFNQVAGEFQLFQVLVQRFLENEQFQGPRVQNYVNNRCVLRSLLQVPLLRDDNLKDKGKVANESNEDAVTIQMLSAIIEQSMKVFWDFVRVDKDETNAFFHLQSHFSLENPANLELLTDVRTSFQKKEKKLKDVLRSGNCIVKKFKKQREDQGMNQTVLIAQVELKLVAMVLNSSSLTAEKLLWCHEKLDKISVCSRKVFVEPSFLLFPC